jgi:iduronate 2-sulfatase
MHTNSLTCSLLNFRLALLVMVMATLATVLPAADRPNVLLIVSDDLNTDIGCYGKSFMYTPGIDSLAARGVRFSHAFCQYPLCNPSRSSFLTGLRPDRTNVFDNAKAVREVVPNLVTMPEAFRKAGYKAVRIGKLYHYGVPKDIGTDGLDDKLSWDYVINPRGRDKDVEDKIFSLTPGNFGGTLSWLADEGEDAEYTDGIVSEKAVEELNKLKDQPFFLAVGFYRPHTPYVAPKTWFEKYPLDKIVIPEIRKPDQNPPAIPKAALASYKKEQEKLTDDLRREAIQAYRSSTSHMDAQVAKVLKALDDEGLRDNTIVIFISDHGYSLGEHGLWQKMSIFDRQSQVPMIIAGPGIQQGKTSSSPVELVDLFPTLADICGIAKPAYLSGASLRPQLTDVHAKVHQVAFSMVRDGRSIRTERWRYTEWSGGKEGVELYDHDADPGELNNLAKDPSQAANIAGLKKLLEAETGK